MKIFYMLIILVGLYGCSSSTKKSKNYVLKFKGSESMHALFDMLKSEFERSQDSVKLVIEGGGSNLGLKAIKDGTADVGLSSFQFDLDSVLGEGHGVSEFPLAYDGIVIISHKENPISQLTDQQIKGIFSGKINNWSQIGGFPGQIIPVIRDENSGTQKFFEEYFNIEKFNPMAVVSSDNSAIVSRVNENMNGIGFIGFGYFTISINSLEIASKDSLEGFISPTFKNLGDGSYPLRRSLQMYYKDSSNPALQAFLEYLKTKDAHFIIKEQGLLPIAPKELVYNQ